MVRLFVYKQILIEDEKSISLRVFHGLFHLYDITCIK